ncbi:PLP-dependent aminotransferase family protein [Paenibacillus rhizovicinus]|uniref:PLP-dependent aminotransferase family protein n=1 Tax=Paenibacillus rhizovicinus TaxID=2704463 RepID=A0A6C0NWT3_9BACL|nr:PLP-dependent aminotransferase family protein [Paenibacillus rhizovicinus]QHW30685.1 PLP-dependent aminotransferase family protein [Paenibacillus rhizovicinus]
MKEHRLRRAKGMETASLADLLQSDRLEEVISFAGDWPAESVIPSVESAATAASEGLLSLGERVCAYMGARHGIRAVPDDVLVTSSSGASIALIVRTLLQPGDAVLVDSPTNPESLRVFRQAKLRVVPVSSDSEGMLIADVERLVELHHPKLIYAMPTLAVPDSRIWSEERRMALVDISRRNGILIIEDNSYGELLFSNSPPLPPTLFETARRSGGSGVLCTGTFAALFGQKLPAGWIIGSGSVMARLVETGSTNGHDRAELQAQRKLERVLQHGDLEQHACAIRMSLEARLHHMQALLRQHSLNGVTWNEPQGGLFLWVELPPGLDAEALLRIAAAKRVTFDAGASFYAENPQRNRVRLNVSGQPDGRMAKGIARFAEAVNEFLGRASASHSE